MVGHNGKDEMMVRYICTIVRTAKSVSEWMSEYLAPLNPLSGRPAVRPAKSPSGPKSPSPPQELERRHLRGAELSSNN